MNTNMKGHPLDVLPRMTKCRTFYDSSFLENKYYCTLDRLIYKLEVAVIFFGCWLLGKEGQSLSWGINKENQLTSEDHWLL